MHRVYEKTFLMRSFRLTKTFIMRESLRHCIECWTIFQNNLVVQRVECTTLWFIPIQNWPGEWGWERDIYSHLVPVPESSKSQLQHYNWTVLILKLYGTSRAIGNATHNPVIRGRQLCFSKLLNVQRMKELFRSMKNLDLSTYCTVDISWAV